MPSSPRSSADTARSPTSPFLHNISNRLRKGSVASHASSQGSEPSHHAQEVTEKAESAQATKRYLLSIVRNDWEYPDIKETNNTEILSREPTSYRRREESGSDVDSDALIAANSTKNDPYKFDSPDEIAASIQERKRKKRRLIEEELQWNDCLKHWTLQRDAWTGAVNHRPPAKDDDEHDKMQVDSEPPALHARDGSADTGTTQGTGQSLASWPIPEDIDTSASSSSIEPEKYPSTNTELTQDILIDGPYLPIYPPLLPMSHTLRSRIKPAAYSTIYDKVVIQSLTPNVPIPLTHMIGALVAGWKAEGQWPPPSMEQRALAARKGKKGDSAFAKWRKEQEDKKKAGVTSSAAGPGHPNRGMRRSISSAVKKVLGMDEERDQVHKELQEIGLTFDDETTPLESQQATEDNKVLNKELLG